MSGYVKIYRTLMSKGYYSDSEYVHLWVHLLMKATYCKKEYLFNNKIEHLKPGQFITGRHSLVKETGINRSKIERILKCFESEHQIEQQTTNKFRIISILNWDEYQNDEQQNEQPVSSQRAASEQPVSTIKKEKKEKKEKNIYADSVSMTENEYKKLLSENGEYITKKAIQLLSNYKLSSGKRYKSDYHAILTWALDKAKGAGNGNTAGRPWLRQTPAEDPEVVSDVEAINARFRAKQLARGIIEKSPGDPPKKDAP